MTNSEIATLSAVSDAPKPPGLTRLHELTACYHKTPFQTLRTAASLDRRGLLKSVTDKDGQGNPMLDKAGKEAIRYHITDAGREALGD